MAIPCSENTIGFTELCLRLGELVTVCDQFLKFTVIQLKHEVPGTLNITFNSLFQDFSFYTIHFSQMKIEHNFLTLISKILF